MILKKVFQSTFKLPKINNKNFLIVCIFYHRFKIKSTLLEGNCINLLFNTLPDNHAF